MFLEPSLYIIIEWMGTWQVFSTQVVKKQMHHLKHNALNQDNCPNRYFVCVCLRVRVDHAILLSYLLDQMSHYKRRRILENLNTRR